MQITDPGVITGLGSGGLLIYLVFRDAVLPAFKRRNGSGNGQTIALELQALARIESALDKANDHLIKLVTIAERNGGR